MKILFFLFFSFLILSCQKEENRTIDLDTFNYDRTIIDSSITFVDNLYTKKVLLDFIADVSKNNLNHFKVFNKIENLYGIIILDLKPYKLLGLTIYHSSINGLIVLDERLLYDFNLFKFVLYHELGHWFGLKHCNCTNDIMLNKYSKEDVKILIKNWNFSVKLFFEKIKEIL